jgi:hypothetical protein
MQLLTGGGDFGFAWLRNRLPPAFAKVKVAAVPNAFGVGNSDSFRQ